MPSVSIILFDGECNLCNSAVQFIIKRDPKKQFRFASLQSPIGRKLLRRYHLSPACNTMVLIEKGHAYQKSAAALRICRKLNGGWPLLFLFLIVPRFIRDRVYDFIARNRYRWFGTRNECMLPSPQLTRRFVS